ncbi:hypothetical protein FALBO_10618 [Fusarium albosuccineum]|uniref:Uncharacterized protein n=1 Tax=Fusarium albosuccineum TaxID=1237068 RepID=A0A8H4L7H2_9HYPO|nr:hypothetical protein FALBO_10618 [Fusarium albosuccineum]
MKTRKRRQYWTPAEPCPREIITSIPGPSVFSRMDVIHEAMKTCSSITTLSIRPTFSGCYAGPDRWNLPFDLTGSEIYLSSPEVLELERYDFSDREWDTIRPPQLEWAPQWPPSLGWSSLSWWCSDIMSYPYELMQRWCSWASSSRASQWRNLRSLPPKQRQKTNLELWMDAMDFTGVKTLAIKNPRVHSREDPLFTKLPRVLHNVRNLTIWGSWGCTDGGCFDQDGVPIPSALTFILALSHNSLTHLTWLDGGTCDADILKRVLERHSSTLETLEWRHSEINWHRRPVFTAAGFRSMGALLPNLRTLIIDLNRNEDMPYAELTAIAESFPNLTRLTTYWELSDDTKDLTVPLGPDDESWEDFYKYPKITEAEFLSLFNYIQSAKVGKKFESVQFRAGDWTRSYHSGVRSMKSWLEQRYLWFEFPVDGASKDGYLCQELQLDRGLDDKLESVYSFAELADRYGGSIKSWDVESDI